MPHRGGSTKRAWRASGSERGIKPRLSGTQNLHAWPHGLCSMTANLISQVPSHLLLVDCFAAVESDIGCARLWMSPLAQSGHDILLLSGVDAFTDTPFVEPTRILRLPAWQRKVSLAVMLWANPGGRRLALTQHGKSNGLS